MADYSSQLKKISIPQFEAVRWRFQVEALVEYTKNYSPSLLVAYEDVCRDPHGKTKEIFDFLGWQFTQATEDFINSKTKS